jgi:hypothetical protein
VAAKVFLTVQRVSGEQHTPHPEFLDQGLDGGDLVALGDLLVGEDERRFAAESAQHLSGGLVVKVIETAPECFAIKRDDVPAGRCDRAAQLGGMPAEDRLEVTWIEGVKEAAQGVDRRGAAEAGAESGVEPLAMHADEQANAAVGGGIGEDGQNTEQQQVW